MNIKELRAKRADLAKQARKILTDAGENFTAEHDAQTASIYSEIELIDARIEKEDKLLAIEAGVDSPEARGRKVSEITGKTADEETANEVRAAAIFAKWARSGDRALNAEDIEFIRTRPNATMSTTTNSEGGYTVPRRMATALIERLKAFGGVRAVASQMSTDGGNPMDYPTVDETSQTGELVAENATATDQDIAFGTKAIGAFRYSSKVVTVPIELLADSAFDLEAFINKALTTRLGRITNTHFTTGTGSGQPEGIVTAASQGKVAAVGNTTTISYDDFVDINHALDPAYRANAGYMFHDDVLKIAKKLKDTTGRPLWRPGMSGNDPDNINGLPYTINQGMATPAANAKSILCGDFSTYMIRDALDVMLMRFADSAYMKKGQIGFLAFMRTDGKLLSVSGDTVKFFQQSAT